MYTGHDVTLTSTADVYSSVLQHWDSNTTEQDSNLIQDVDQPKPSMSWPKDSQVQSALERSGTIAFVKQGVTRRAVPYLCPHSVLYIT